MFRPTVIAVSLLALGVAGCSSSKKNNNQPDGGGSGSGSGTDAPPASNCISSPAYDPPDYYAQDGFAGWQGAFTTDLGDGVPSRIQFEFYDLGNGTDLTQPIDLSMGDFANYKSCEACIHAVSPNSDPSMAPVRDYFQDGGTIKLAMDPITSKHLMLQATDVSLIEVTIDYQGDFTSTPVANGKCIALGSFTLDRDNVPHLWTCDKAKYEDGASCDCACGAVDPDCGATPALPVAGCTANQVCGSDATCIDTCQAFAAPPVGCTAANQTCGVNTASDDLSQICIASDDTQFDTAAIGATCTAGTQCGVTNTIATGFCDFFANDDEKCRKGCDGNSDCLGTETCQPVRGTVGLCVPKSANDTCQTAVALTVGTPVNGTTGGATSNYNAGLEAATCTGFSQKGRDVAYKATLTAGTQYTFTLTNVTPEFDPSISIVGPGAATVCDAATITCDAGADANTAGMGETVTYTPTTTGTYYVIVDSFDDTFGGSFTLTATSP